MERDPARALRGSYWSEEALRATAGPQGWPALFGRLLEEAGLVRTGAPQLGDVAIILDHENRLHAAVRTAVGFVTAAEPVGLWAMRDALVPRIVKAWTFP